MNAPEVTCPGMSGRRTPSFTGARRSSLRGLGDVRLRSPQRYVLVLSPSGFTIDDPVRTAHPDRDRHSGRGRHLQVVHAGPGRVHCSPGVIGGVDDDLFGIAVHRVAYDGSLPFDDCARLAVAVDVT